MRPELRNHRIGDVSESGRSLSQVGPSQKVLARPRGVSAPPGPLSVYGSRLVVYGFAVNTRRLVGVTPQVSTEDLIDAAGIAELLGLAQRNTVSLYQRRYPDMPRPVLDLGSGRPRLWLRPQIEEWARQTGRRE